MVGPASSCLAPPAEALAMHDEDEDLTDREVLCMALVVLVLIPVIWTVDLWRKISGKET